MFTNKKNLNYPKFEYSFPCEKVNFSFRHPTQIIFTFRKLSLKAAF